MTGAQIHETVDNVRSHWRAHARTVGFFHAAAIRRVHELHYSDAEAQVFIGNGCYVADCPNPACRGAAAAWKENPECCCLSCGWVFTPIWPPAAELERAIPILLMRADPMTRNWRVGIETIDDLKTQNLLHGELGVTPRDATETALAEALGS